MKVNIKSMPKAFAFLPLIGLVFLSSCSIRPVAWNPLPAPAFESELELNTELVASKKIDLLGYYGAEDFVVDSEGFLYTGVHSSPTDFSSGAILRFKKDGSAEEFMKTSGWITGMSFDQTGGLVALMHGVGLLRIQAGRVDTLLTHTSDGKPLLMGAGLKIDQEGMIYFTNLSSTNKPSPKYFNKLILEMKPTGGVYRYDPKLDLVTEISSGNYFGNGLELSENEDFLLVSETSKYRILKYWLKGPKAGTKEVFADNLPGFPNNISRAKNGNYWLGFTTKRNMQLEKLHSKPGMKKIVYSLPSFLQPAPEAFGMVLELDDSGKITRALFDPSGETVKEAGAVFENEGCLFLGGDVVQYVSKIKIK